jgi:hypothetical protein
LLPAAVGVIVTGLVPVPEQSPEAVMVTDKPELEVAVAVNVEPKVLVPGLVKEIFCEALLIVRFAVALVLKL